MANYRKKPVVIQATQWLKSGDHPEDNCQTFVSTGMYDLPAGTEFQGEGAIVRYFRNPNVRANKICPRCNQIMHTHGWIDTLEGGYIVCPGDMIITGVMGKHYPCKPAIFAATYELVPDHE